MTRQELDLYLKQSPFDTFLIRENDGGECLVYFTVSTGGIRKHSNDEKGATVGGNGSTEEQTVASQAVSYLENGIEIHGYEVSLEEYIEERYGEDVDDGTWEYEHLQSP